jgi:hypothetical protein
MSREKLQEILNGVIIVSVGCLILLLITGLPALLGVGLSGVLSRLGLVGDILQGILLVAGILLTLFLVFALMIGVSGMAEYIMLMASGTAGFSIGLGLTWHFGFTWIVAAYSVAVSQVVPWLILLIVMLLAMLTQYRRKSKA